MKTVIFYFHGYNSSAKTDKVLRLESHGFEVHAWDIDLDLDISMPFLEEKIDGVLIDHINHDLNLVFIGTSLGAWYASKLADMYDARAILVNPAHEPSKTLAGLNAKQELADKYDDITINQNDIVVVANDDELIDHSNRDYSKAKKVIYSETGGHRFNGEEFNIVIDLI